MIAEGALPHFAELQRAGVQAELETVEPVISPTVWTSIATGRSPDAHHIVNFLQTALDRPVPTVFERLSAAGHRVGVYDYLVTWPPAPLANGFLVPGWTRRGPEVWPSDVFARAGSAPGYRYSLDGLRFRAEYLANCREELEKKAGQWLALARAFDVDVGAVTFYSVDALSHRFWRDAFPEQFAGGGPPPDPAYAGVLREALTGVDRALGEVRASLAPEDVLLLASDHGFQAEQSGREPIWTSNVEPTLRAAGLDPERDPFRIVSQFYTVTIRVLPGPLPERDALTDRITAALGALRAANGGDPLYEIEVVDGAPRPAGSERPWLVRARQWVVRQVAYYMFHIEFGEDAHAFVLARPLGGAMSALGQDGMVAGPDGAPARRLSEIAAPDFFTGRHHPIGVFLAAGGPIRPQSERQHVSVLEIAPLIVQLAGEPIPDDLERPLRTDLLDPAWLAAHPPRVVPASSLPPPPRAGAVDGEAGGEALRERLRGMGYIQ